MRDDINRSMVVARSALSGGQRDEMYQLLDAHFAGVTRDRFEGDLSEKDWVILVMQGNRLVGFSTMLAYEAICDDQPVSVIYSGDTIMARDAWGSTALPRAWIDTVNGLRDLHPRGGFYWLLLTSGFRTYRFLSVFWRMFWPRFDRATPPASKRLLDQLAAERFGNQYDPAAGVVRFRQPQRLRRELVEVPAGRVEDPHVACFLARNPGHARGDELVCLTDLSAENLTPAGRRMIGARIHGAVISHR
ncbi:MAG TPA: hypothetical protein VJS65_10725 [Verrucomicrobiae bacterium]|nr:hypothetical protein [Verrucomicrobiae bacterium]